MVLGLVLWLILLPVIALLILVLILILILVLLLLLLLLEELLGEEVVELRLLVRGVEPQGLLIGLEGLLQLLLLDLGIAQVVIDRSPLGVGHRHRLALGKGAKHLLGGGIVARGVVGVGQVEGRLQRERVLLECLPILGACLTHLPLIVVAVAAANKASLGVLLAPRLIHAHKAQEGYNQHCI